MYAVVLHSDVHGPGQGCLCLPNITEEYNNDSSDVDDNVREEKHSVSDATDDFPFPQTLLLRFRLGFLVAELFEDLADYPDVLCQGGAYLHFRDISVDVVVFNITGRDPEVSSTVVGR